MENKPCPFCGTKPFLKYSEDESLWPYSIIVYSKIGCSNCDYSAIFHDDEKGEQAKNWWNTRPSTWISVKDRLPDKEYKTDKFSKIIIICYDSIYGKSVTTGYYDYELKRWNHSDCDAHPDVVCYQYLPEPPGDE